MGNNMEKVSIKVTKIASQGKESGQMERGLSGWTEKLLIFNDD